MGFFKDFKDDFSQAMNELLPGEDPIDEEPIEVNTLGDELDVAGELSKLDGLLQQVEKKTSEKEAAQKEAAKQATVLDNLSAMDSEQENAEAGTVEEPELAPLDPEPEEQPQEETVSETASDEPQEEEEPVVAVETEPMEAPEIAEETVETSEELSATIQKELDKLEEKENEKDKRSWSTKIGHQNRRLKD